jgi:NAD(P)-dependent dehydrogenase (short-subunit alcohol dehydrogenase family)
MKLRFIFHQVWIRSVDVGSDIDVVQQEFNGIVEQAGKSIDVLINCAGIVPISSSSVCTEL